MKLDVLELVLFSVIMFILLFILCCYSEKCKDEDREKLIKNIAKEIKKKDGDDND